MLHQLPSNLLQCAGPLAFALTTLCIHGNTVCLADIQCRSGQIQWMSSIAAALGHGCLLHQCWCGVSFLLIVPLWQTRCVVCISLELSVAPLSTAAWSGRQHVIVDGFPTSSMTFSKCEASFTVQSLPKRPSVVSHCPGGRPKMKFHEQERKTARRDGMKTDEKPHLCILWG